MTRALAVAVLLLVACNRRAAVTSCDDDLHGVWVAPDGARWDMLDHGATLEAYPMFDDAVAEGAPRRIALERHQKLAGEMMRRYTRGAESCEAHAPLRIAKCKDNELQVVLADPQPPLAFAPCTWGRPADSRLEHWHRE